MFTDSRISCAEPGAMPWLGLPFAVCVHGCVVVIVCWYMYCVALSVAVCHHVFRVTVCDCITVSALYMWDWAYKCGYQVSELLTAPSGTVHSITIKLSLHMRGHPLSTCEGFSL